MTKKPDESTETVEGIKKETKEISEALGEHLLRGMLLRWLLVPVTVTITVLIVYVLSTTGALTAMSGNPSPVQVDVSVLGSINSNIFAASLTFTGIILGVVPIVTFFYLGELKDSLPQIKNIHKDRKRGQTNEIKKLLDAQDYLYEVIATNMKKAIVRYTEIAVTSSIGLALLLVFVYGWIGIQASMVSGTSAMANYFVLNMIINMIILFYVGFEALAIWWIGLSRSGYKVNRFKKNGVEYTLLTPEE